MPLERVWWMRISDYVFFCVNGLLFMLWYKRSIDLGGSRRGSNLGDVAHTSTTLGLSLDLLSFLFDLLPIFILECYTLVIWLPYGLQYILVCVYVMVLWFGNEQEFNYFTFLFSHVQLIKPLRVWTRWFKDYWW